MGFVSTKYVQGTDRVPDTTKNRQKNKWKLDLRCLVGPRLAGAMFLLLNEIFLSCTTDSEIILLLCQVFPFQVFNNSKPINIFAHSKNPPWLRSYSRDTRSKPPHVSPNCLWGPAVVWKLALCSPNGISCKCTGQNCTSHWAVGSLWRVHFSKPQSPPRRRCCLSTPPQR